MTGRKSTEDLERPKGNDHFDDIFVHGRTLRGGISEKACVKL